MRKLSFLLLSSLCFGFSANASMVKYYSTFTSDGKQLGLNLSERPVTLNNWTVFRYYIKSSDNKITRRTGVTSWCNEQGNVKKFFTVTPTQYLVNPVWAKDPYTLKQIIIMKEALSDYSGIIKLIPDTSKNWITTIDNRAINIVADTNLTNQFLINICASSVSQLD